MSLLVVAALPLELGEHFKDVPHVFTGVGKVNAALSLTRYVCEQMGSRKIVVNFGSAGSRTHAPGTMLAATSFVQRDMDCRPIGSPRFATPFDEFDPSGVINFPSMTPWLQEAVCFTGDQFVNNRTAKFFQGVLDMEAYALAKVCKALQMRFACVKRVTDGADASAGDTWEREASRISGEFREQYERIKTAVRRGEYEELFEMATPDSWKPY